MITFKQDGNKSGLPYDDTVELDSMLKFLNTKMYEQDKKDLPGLCKDGPYRVVTAEPGRKYIKLVVASSGSRSVYCFIDMEGNIYKAASWKAPAKHIRGSVFDESYSWGRALGMYGAAYLR
jgi:hypothetical protein